MADAEQRFRNNSRCGERDGKPWVAGDGELRLHDYGVIADLEYATDSGYADGNGDDAHRESGEPCLFPADVFFSAEWNRAGGAGVHGGEHEPGVGSEFYRGTRIELRMAEAECDERNNAVCQSSGYHVFGEYCRAGSEYLVQLYVVDRLLEFVQYAAGGGDAGSGSVGGDGGAVVADV
jgi:hypothetical protein